MNITEPLVMLGGLSPERFMKRHWQKKPLLVRQAFPGIEPPQSRAQLFALAESDDVESRFVRQQQAAWTVRYGLHRLGRVACNIATAPGI